MYVVSSRIEEFEGSLDSSRKSPRPARAGPGHQVRSEKSRIPPPQDLSNFPLKVSPKYTKWGLLERSKLAVISELYTYKR